MTENPITLYFVVGLCALIIGIGKGGLGAAFAPLATPILVLVLPVNQVLALVAGIPNGGRRFAVGAHWKRWDSKLASAADPRRVRGCRYRHAFHYKRLAPECCALTLAVVILLFAAYKLFERRNSWELWCIARAAGTAVAAGSISGFTSAIANNGGPPVTIYLLSTICSRVYLSPPPRCSS